MNTQPTQPTEEQLRERLRRRRYGSATTIEWDTDPVDDTVRVASDIDVGYVQHPTGFDYGAAKAEFEFAQRTNLDQQQWDVAVGKNWSSLELSVKEYTTKMTRIRFKNAQAAADAQAAAEYRKRSTLSRKLANAAARMKSTRERANARVVETIWERTKSPVRTSPVRDTRGRTPKTSRRKGIVKNPKPSGVGGITVTDRERWAKRALKAKRWAIIDR